MKWCFCAPIKIKLNFTGFESLFFYQLINQHFFQPNEELYGHYFLYLIKKPYLFGRFILEPNILAALVISASFNNFTISGYPFKVAIWRGVLPRLEIKIKFTCLGCLKERPEKLIVLQCHDVPLVHLHGEEFFQILDIKLKNLTCLEFLNQHPWQLKVERSESFPKMQLNEEVFAH